MVDESRQAPIQGSCPDPEAIAAFVDGRLPESERAAMEAHLASCEDCYTVFTETARSEEELGAAATGSPVVRGRFGRKWIYLAAAAALVAAAIPVALIRERRHARPPLVAELVAAVGAERPFEPRLTGGFRFGPMAPRYRSAKPLSESDSWEVLAAAAKIRKNDEEHSTPATLDALGAANLILGKYDDAVSNLEEATLEEPKNARYLTDLSAAYLVRAKEKDRADDYPKALEAAEKATEIAPAILEAWFNRALALDELPLKTEAAKAWNDYLQRDSTSGWAEEAKKRLAAIRAIPNHAEEWKKARAKMLAAARAGDQKTLRELMPDWCQETREWIEDEVLPHWAEADREGGDGAAAPKAGAVETLVSFQAEASGDPIVRDSIEAIRRLPDRAAVLRGIADFARARSLSREKRFGESERAAEKAAQELKGLGLAFEAQLIRASDAFRKGDLEAADRIASSVAAGTETPGYRSAAARALWLRGLIAQYRSRPLDSVATFNDASGLFRACGEKGNRARVEALLAEVEDDLGGEEASAGHRLTELRLGLPLADDPAMAETLAGEAYDLMDFGDYRSAMHVLGEISRTPGFARDPGTRGTVWIAAGIAAARLGAAGESRAAFDRARVVAPLLPEPDRSRLDAEIEAEEARAELPARAAWHLARWPKLADEWRRLGLADRQSELYTLRARARRGVGDLTGAQEDFERAISAFESGRKDPGPWNPNSDRLWDLFGNAIAFSVDRDPRGLGALDLLEEARATAATSRRNPPGWRFSVQGISEIPPRTAILHYLAREGSLFSWLTTSRGVRFVKRAASPAEIRAAADRFRRALFERPSSASRTAGASLSRLLLGPFVREIRNSDSLVFAPDSALAGVPFAALPDPVTEKALVDGHAVSLAGSGTGYLHSISRRRSLDPASVLMVVGPGSPDGDPSAAPLPGTDRERDVLRKAFSRVDVLAGEDATPANVLQDAPGHDIIYFAGHALSGGRNPGLSRLVLASPPNLPNSGGLFAATIARADLSGVRLVVLAACRTGEEPGSPSRGPRNLAAAFLDAGASDVVATLWDVDREIAPFMSRFVPALASCGSPRRAFWLTQRDLSRASRGRSRGASRNWYVFDIIGG